MKKGLLAIAFILVSFGMNAQILEQGNSMINLGLGLGAYSGSGSGYSQTVPPIYASYEYMINDNISVGPYVGYHASEYKWAYAGISAKWTYSYLNIAGIANYHFVNNDELDVYGGLKLGYTSINSDFEDSEGTNYSSLGLNFDTSGVLFGAQLGARYFFSESFGVNLELGYGVALAQAGITIKL